MPDLQMDPLMRHTDTRRVFLQSHVPSQRKGSRLLKCQSLECCLAQDLPQSGRTFAGTLMTNGLGSDDDGALAMLSWYQEKTARLEKLSNRQSALLVGVTNNLGQTCGTRTGFNVMVLVLDLYLIQSRRTKTFL
jgi:hypothetical protein